MEYFSKHIILKIFLILNAFFLVQNSFAQIKFDEHFTWKSETEKISDKEYKVKFICTLDDGWHMFSQYMEEGGSQPTVFRFEKNKDIQLVGKVEEEGNAIKEHSEVFGTDEIFFEDKIVFVQHVKIKDENAVLKGEFEGQVCATQCILYGPEQFAVSFKEKSATDPIDTTGQVTTLPIDSVHTAAALPKISRFDTTYINNACSVKMQPEDRSYWVVFLLGFLGGLLALLTPCVFPMVPLTVSFFTQGGKNKKQGLRKAITYGISIVVIYVLLGLLITGIFGSDALNAMSTNIWFNLLFFFVFVIFAISFFGFFEITLPSSWANKADALSGKGGNIGIFFMAFTLALVSFSCTGPIIGTLLVQAATGGGPTLFHYIPLKPLLGMFGFSLALALPFTLFALFPRWLHSLPKSGGWLNTVKDVLGFLELALAFKFLSIVDMTQNWGLVRWEPFLIIWMLIFIGLALYCFGFIRFPHDNKKEKPGIVPKSIGLLSILFVAYLGYGLFTYQPLKLLSGLAPPVSYNFRSDNKEKFKHFKDYGEGLAYAKAHNMPILLDFTGYGCVNCRKIEEHVWTDEKIIDLFQHYVVISLYVDDKQALPEKEWYTSDATGKQREVKTVGQKWSDFQAKYFNANSQPSYVLINPDEQLLNYPVDYQFSSDVRNYESFLKCGLSMHRQIK